jgi:hypothetical protein
MTEWKSPDVQLHVYTFKQGLLSAVGHDLLLAATDVRVDETEHTLTVEVRADSLRTVCAMRHGERAPGALSEKDKGEIDRNTRRSVLHTDRFPLVRFTATSRTEALIEGTLDLHGTQRTVRVPQSKAGDRRVGVVELDQRDWGVEPYSALLGALKVQPVVRIEISLPPRVP